MTQHADFDDYAADYDAALDLGISVSGEDKLYFARGRVEWLHRCLSRLGEHPRTVLDFGCGVGGSIPYLLDVLRTESVIGVDSSAKSLEAGRKRLRPERVRMISLEDYRPEGQMELAFSNGVFHHIAIAQRDAAMKLVFDSLRPGGIFALWENNPWNPGTRYVMSRIPFDRDAVPLSAPEACRLARKAGFEILQVDFLFIFPRFLRSLRSVEPLLSRFPLGAQYQILCRRPAA